MPRAVGAPPPPERRAERASSDSRRRPRRDEQKRLEGLAAPSPAGREIASPSVDDMVKSASLLN